MLVLSAVMSEAAFNSGGELNVSTGVDVAVELDASLFYDVSTDVETLPREFVC